MAETQKMVAEGTKQDMVKPEKIKMQSLTSKSLEDQPEQLELFRLTAGTYTNAFEFYESIPRFVVGGSRSSYINHEGNIERIKWNPDGTALPIEKVYEHRGNIYDLRINPAPVKQRNGKFKALYPGIREEIIEFIIFKLAVEKAYFYGGEQGSNKDTDNFVLITSIYEIQQELKKRKGAKTSPYNNAQVKEALEVLQGTNLRLAGKNKDVEQNFNFSPIAEFGYFEKEKKDASGRRATLYIKFNSLVSKSILAKKWRQINYDQVMLDKDYLGRWFRKTLGLKFTYAVQNRSFNLLLSTVINLSGISPYGKITNNEAYVKRILDGMDIVEKVIIQKKYAINPKTKRKVLKDVLIEIFPTKEFIGGQIHSNIHDNRLKEAIFDDDGKVILKPQTEDFQNMVEYRRAMNAYEKKR